MKHQVKLHTTLSTSASSLKGTNKSLPLFFSFFLESRTESFLRMWSRAGLLALPVPLDPVAGYVTCPCHHSAATLITATAGGTGQKHSEV